MIFRMMISEIPEMGTSRTPEDIIIFSAISLPPLVAASEFKSDGTINHSQYNGFLRDFNIFYSNFYSTRICFCGHRDINEDVKKELDNLLD